MMTGCQCQFCGEVGYRSPDRLQLLAAVGVGSLIAIGVKMLCLLIFTSG
jgi:hypothetical protein